VSAISGCNLQQLGPGFSGGAGQSAAGAAVDVGGPWGILDGH